MMAVLTTRLRRHRLLRSLLVEVRRRLRSREAMMFPTFDAGIHRMALGDADYFRLATLGLALRRLERERIVGAIAEVGVYRGDTSVFLDAVAPSRTLYLFDTFTGFPQADLAAHRYGDSRFQDTSAEAVHRRLGSRAEVRLLPGRVPDTFTGLDEEQFAFVLLDLDLYEPTLASLRFFYPRLTSGGYLAVHDYNNPESDWACRRALDGFLDDKPERLVELADIMGTAMFRKA